MVLLKRNIMLHKRLKSKQRGDGAAHPEHGRRRKDTYR